MLIRHAVRQITRTAICLCWAGCCYCFADDFKLGVGADREIQALVDAGQFTDAEARLRQSVPADAPVTTPAAIQLEILRRIRLDFPWSEDQILEQVRGQIPDANHEDILRWRAAGHLQYREIDQEHRYFRRAVSNLLRWNANARARRMPVDAPNVDKATELNRLLEEIVQMADASPVAEIYPVRHRVRYQISVSSGHPRLRRNAVVRAWLPFPQEYGRQRDVRLIRSSPPHLRITPNGEPHRSVYFEQRIDEETPAPVFVVEFEYVSSAYCPRLDASDVQAYDTDSPLYREYTAERLPHIPLSPMVKTLADEIVGDVTNPLSKARRIFQWVSSHIPWCAELEYSTIPSLAEKGLAARRGDCGVQGMTFVTLCRAAGIPARWQSGWITLPTGWNMHDWSEFYVEPWGWLPADASYGTRDLSAARVRDFYCGGLDPYRLIVNLDYARPLQPAKTSFRSEPNDFQRGEVEIDGHNLYFNEWDWTFQVETETLK